MRYFSVFPKGYYPFEIGGQVRPVLIKDVVLNVRFQKLIASSITVYDLYEMSNDEKIEHVAAKLYSNPDLYWVLMLLNERYDYRTDFPMSVNDLEKYVRSKYTNPFDVHVIYGQPHYEDADGNLVDATEPGAIPISNYDYEFRLNESKRLIKVISPQQMSNVVTQMETAFRSLRNG